MAALTVTESIALTSLRSFLLSVLPAGVEVIRGQPNRVAEPASPNFVVMTATIRGRLEWNIDAYADVAFIGSAANGTLTVTQVQTGTIVTGAQLLGSGVLASGTITSIGAQLSGSLGGTGTYALSAPQSFPSQQLASGIKTLLQPTEMVVQLDVHGPSAGDNVQIITTAFFDEYAHDAFDSYGQDVHPLYCDPAPRQAGFINGEQQWEERWIIEAHLQINPVLAVPQQFFTSVTVGLHAGVGGVFAPS